MNSAKDALDVAELEYQQAVNAGNEYFQIYLRKIDGLES